MCYGFRRKPTSKFDTPDTWSKIVEPTETKPAGTVVNLYISSGRGLYTYALMLENWGLEYALLGVQAPRSGTVDAELWFDLTYISPNPPFLQRHFGSRNMYQMFLKVLLRIALACGRKVWLHPHLHPHHVSSVPSRTCRWDQPNRGPNRKDGPRSVGWHYRTIDGEKDLPTPGQSCSRWALSKVLRHRTPFPRLCEFKGLRQD